MVRMVPVDSQRHTGKGWRPQAGYAFAATQALVPLSVVEFGKAAVAMPIAFIESSGRYIPVAVTSPVEGRNLYVSPTGQWLGSYVPAALRSYPFRLGKAEGSSDRCLLVDEDSGWVIDADEHTARFFEEDGGPSAALKSIIQLLQELEQAWALTNMAVAALAEVDLIRPWPLIATIGNQQVAVTGLHRVDEAALEAVDEQTFMKLRKTSSLAAAYAQIISAHTVDLLRTLDMAQQQMSVQQNPAPHSLEPFKMNGGETMKF
jgi:hypothetical protein